MGKWKAGFSRLIIFFKKLCADLLLFFKVLMRSLCLVQGQPAAPRVCPGARHRTSLKEPFPIDEVTTALYIGIKIPYKHSISGKKDFTFLFLTDAAGLYVLHFIFRINQYTLSANKKST
jgi:hypothetical protein